MGLRKNIFSNFILTASTILFPLITFPYITRVLSNGHLGKIFFIDAFTQYFIIFSALGIPFYGVREVAKIKGDAAQRSKLVIELLTIQVILAVLFSVIFVLSQFFVPELKGNLDLIKVSCLTIIANAFLIEWFYQGIEEFTYITKRSLVIKVLSVLGILIFIKSDQDYVSYYFILAAVVIGNALLNTGNYFKRFHVRTVDNIDIKKHIRPLTVLFSINLSVSVYAILDTVILGFLTNANDVSLYNVPLKLTKMYWLVVSGVGTVLIPRMASLFVEKDICGIEELLTKSLNIVFLLTIPFGLFCILFSEEVLFLVAGARYLAAADVIRVLSVVPLIIGVCNVMGTQFLLPIGLERKILYATIFGLIVSLALNFALIPDLRSIGAAITCVAAESVVCVYMIFAANKEIKVKVDLSLLCLIFLTAVITAGSSFFMKDHLKGSVLLVSSAVFYGITFLSLHLLFFKNNFINSLISYKR